MSESSAWSRGYPVSESYPSSWHGFQSPAHLRAVCAMMGVIWDVGPDTPLRIIELGCGTGYTSQLMAAGNPHWQVMGLDYNPAHIAEARSMAAAAGLDNVQFVEADLAELSDAELDQLPEFDLVTVHGVWSWVSDAVRDGVLRLLRRRLKAGGVALVSYNAMPGAAGSLGLARLVRQSLLTAENSVAGVALATRLVQQLIPAEPAYLPASPWMRLMTGERDGVRPGYLMHEFQTAYWRPSFHADVAAALATARCDYVGSATVDENFPQMSLSAAQRELWDQAPDANARELIFDLCVPRVFRRDIYVRGLRRGPRDAMVDALPFVSATRDPADPVLRSQAGEAKLPAELVVSVRAALAQGSRSIGQLRTLPGCERVTPSELAALLMGSGCAVPAWRTAGTGAPWAQAVAAARRLNVVAADRLAPHGIGDGQLGLATPVLGGGLRCSAMELAVARLVAEFPHETGDAPALVRRLVPAGPLPGPAVLAELHEVVTRLIDYRLPVWQALQITPA